MSSESDVTGLVADALARGHSLRLRALGGSMLPFIRHGDVLLLRRVRPHEISAGDVVCYRPCRDRLVVHRVVSRTASDVVVKGDALTWSDVVPAASVLARAVAIERRGRRRRLDTRAARWASRIAVAIAPAVPALLAVGRAMRSTLRTGAGRVR